MANHERGEVGLRAGERVYILKPTTNAICEMEEASGRTFQAILATIQADGGFRDIRLFLWGLLRAHHPEVTLEQAGDIIDAAGGVLGVVAQLEKVIAVNTPTKGRAGNPRKARGNGTGIGSTSMPVASV